LFLLSRAPLFLSRCRRRCCRRRRPGVPSRNRLVSDLSLRDSLRTDSLLSSPFRSRQLCLEVTFEALLERCLNLSLHLRLLVIDTTHIHYIRYDARQLSAGEYPWQASLPIFRTPRRLRRQRGQFLPTLRLSHMRPIVDPIRHGTLSGSPFRAQFRFVSMISSMYREMTSCTRVLWLFLGLDFDGLTLPRWYSLLFLLNSVIPHVRVIPLISTTPCPTSSCLAPFVLICFY
jgi:hypothetical protein